jgi:hypothetical protein
MSPGVENETLFTKVSSTDFETKALFVPGDTLGGMHRSRCTHGSPLGVTKTQQSVNSQSHGGDETTLRSTDEPHVTSKKRRIRVSR